MGGVMLAWMAEVGIITFRNTRSGSKQNIGGLPLPSVYLSSVVVYGALGVLGRSQAQVANLAAWGLTLATYMNYVDLANNKVGKSKVTAATTPPPSPGQKVGTTTQLGG
jgi:hypothetical protein